MDKIKLIARREFAEVLRTRMFWVSVLLPVALMIGVTIYGGRHSSSSGEDARAFQAMGAFIYFFVMFMSITATSQMLVSSLIEEKASRVAEVLLSAVSPFQLMAGKILGLVAVGLATSAVIMVAVSFAAAYSGMLRAPGPALLALFLVYYLLGFTLIASMFAAIGAMFNTHKEAQALLLPLSLLLVAPFMFWVQIARHPDGALAVALSIFPLTAPTVMILRIAVLPSIPWLDVGLSLLLLAAATPLVVWAGSKVFRIGILMYGKQPKLGQILRWIRTG